MAQKKIRLKVPTQLALTPLQQEQFELDVAYVTKVYTEDLPRQLAAAKESERRSNTLLRQNWSKL